jgi:hypothetical protein
MTATTVYTIHVGLNTDGSSDFADRNRADLLGILDDRHSDGYTVFDGVGRYKGENEPTIVVSIAYSDWKAFEVHALHVVETARIIKRNLGQESVWVTSTTVDLVVV